MTRDTNVVDDSTDQDNPAETRIYYDANAGVFVTVTVAADGSVTVETGDGNVTSYESRAEFEDAETDLHVVPERAVSNPVAVAEDVYAAGFTELLENYAVNDIGILYADQHTKIIETDD